MPSLEKTIKEALGENEFELPIGYTDSDGNFHKIVVIKEVDGEVEEEINKRKIRDNGGKVITAFVHKIVERLGTMRSFSGDDARKMYTADRDFILLMSYFVSESDVLTLDNEQCEHCGEKFGVKVNIKDIPVHYYAQEESKVFTKELPRGIDHDGKVYKKITFGLPNGNTAEGISNVVVDNPALAATSMFNSITKSIEGLSSWNFDTFKKMKRKDRNFLSDELKAIKAGPELIRKVACPECKKMCRVLISADILLGE